MAFYCDKKYYEKPYNRGHNNHDTEGYGRVINRRRIKT